MSVAALLVGPQIPSHVAPLPSSAGTAPSGVSASSTWSRQPETVTAGPPDLVAKSNVGNGGTEPKLSVRVLWALPTGSTTLGRWH